MRPSVAHAHPRFWTAYRTFLRIFLWLWFGGIALTLAAAVMGVGKLWITTILLLTIYPSLIGWLGFNGVGILLTWIPRAHERQPERPMLGLLWATTLLLVGVVFTAFSIAMLGVVLWRVLH